MYEIHSNLSESDFAHGVPNNESMSSFWYFALLRHLLSWFPEIVLTKVIHGVWKPKGFWCSFLGNSKFISIQCIQLNYFPFEMHSEISHSNSLTFPEQFRQIIKLQRFQATKLFHWIPYSPLERIKCIEVAAFCYWPNYERIWWIHIPIVNTLTFIIEIVCIHL